MGSAASPQELAEGGSGGGGVGAVGARAAVEGGQEGPRAGQEAGQVGRALCGVGRELCGEGGGAAASELEATAGDAAEGERVGGGFDEVAEGDPAAADEGGELERGGDADHTSERGGLWATAASAA